MNQNDFQPELEEEMEHIPEGHIDSGDKCIDCDCPDFDITAIGNVSQCIEWTNPPEGEDDE